MSTVSVASSPLQNSDSLKKALVSLAAVTSSYFHAAVG